MKYKIAILNSLLYNMFLMNVKIHEAVCNETKLGIKINEEKKKQMRL